MLYNKLNFLHYRNIFLPVYNSNYKAMFFNGINITFYVVKINDYEEKIVTSMYLNKKVTFLSKFQFFFLLFFFK